MARSALAAFFSLAGAEASAQERLGSSTARSSHGRLAASSPGPGAARFAPDVSASRYRGSRARPMRGYGSRGPTRAGTGVWIPGRYERLPSRVLVPGRLERIWVPPVFETRYRPCGTAYRVLVTAGFWKELRHPSRYETRYTRRWVPGRYTYGTGAACRL